MYPWTFVGCIEKCDRKWFIYHPALRIAKHSLRFIVKGFEHLIPIFLWQQKAQKEKKVKEAERDRAT